MQTSRFQLGLIATLAVGLGFSLSSSEAVGYPAGAAVSLGANPLWVVSGSTTDGSEDLATAPIDQDMVITDIYIKKVADWVGCPTGVQLNTGGGVLLVYAHSTSMTRTYATGLIVPAGEAVKTVTPTGCRVYYTLSGYYAQP